MSFSGLPLPTLGVLGLAAAAVVGLSYLLKVHRPELPVPFGALWSSVVEASEARRTSTRLRRRWSLLWQLAMLLALLLALLEPGCATWRAAPQRTIFVLDNSASMSAPVDTASAPGGPATTLDLANQQMLADMGSLRGRDEVAVVTAGGVPEVLFAPDAPAVLRATFDPRMTATGPGDLRGAMRLAEALLPAQDSAATIRVYSDAIPVDLFDDVQYCATGPQRCVAVPSTGIEGNLHVAHFSVRRALSDPKRIAILLETRSASPDETPARVEISANGLPIHGEDVVLRRDAPHRIAFEKFDAAGETFRAQVSLRGETATDVGEDPGFDNVAYASVAPMTPFRVRLVSDRQNLFLDAALLAIQRPLIVERWSYQDAHENTDASPPPDLTILDASDDPRPLPVPDGATIVFDPFKNTTRPFAIESTRAIKRPSLRRHPSGGAITEGLVFKDVNMRRATAMKPAASDTVLLEHLGEAVALLRARDAGPLVVLGFDPAQSDLPLRAAFPLLMDRVFDSLDPPSDVVVPALLAGVPTVWTKSTLSSALKEGDVVEFWRRPDPGDPAPQAPAGKTSVQEGRVAIALDLPGNYRAVVDDVAIAPFAVRGHGDRVPPPATLMAPTPPQPNRWPPPSERPTIASLLVWLLALSLVLEWWTFHRGRTV